MQGSCDGLDASTHELLLQKELNYKGDPDKMEDVHASGTSDRKKRKAEDRSREGFKQVLAGAEPLDGCYGCGRCKAF